MIAWIMLNCAILYQDLCQIHLYGNIIQIRSEDDKERLKNFTKEQKEIRRKYRSKISKKIDPEEYKKIISEFQQAFKEMAGEQKCKK